MIQTVNTLTENMTRVGGGALQSTDTFWGLTEAQWSWILLIVFFAIIVMAFVTMSVQKAFMEKNAKYSMQQSSSQKTGAQVAQEILAKNGITNVRVVQGQEGKDHYNPETQIVSLSPSVFNSSSVSAMAIAAHEVGHAIQFHKKSFLIRVRSILTTPVMIATGVGQMFFSLGLFYILLFGFGAWIFAITFGGIILYGAMAVFQLVTLPVEFDASKRAMNNLKEMGLINNENDLKGSKAVLKAAAMTYVVAFITTLLTFAFFLIRFILIIMNNRR